MDNPIYKLEKVIQGKENETLEDFEGPLDLILFLLGKNKIEIQDIPITLILDQYLEYLEMRQSMDLEIASEFVTMAAHLMYIKTKMLLNLEDEEAQNEMDLLIKSLEERKRNDIYGKIKIVAERIAPLSEFGRNIYCRPPEPVERGKKYEYSHELSDLVIAFQEAIDKKNGNVPENSMKAFDEIVKREPYPVERKAREIFDKLKTNGIMRFLSLFKGSKSRSEVVATFMAVLEMCKNNVIKLAGGVNDCTVTCDGELTDEMKMDGV